MNLQQKIKKAQSERGFTIVELLIVIVVIGILAAIVIVAYNGVQNRARDTNNKSDAVSIVKVAEAKNANETTSGYPTGADSPALVSSFNASDTAKLPNDTTVQLRTAAGDPTYAETKTAAELSPDRTYIVKVCANGVNVYYPIRAQGSGAVGVAKAGQGC